MQRKDEISPEEAKEMGEQLINNYVTGSSDVTAKASELYRVFHNELIDQEKRLKEALKAGNEEEKASALLLSKVYQSLRKKLVEEVVKKEPDIGNNLRRFLQIKESLDTNLKTQTPPTKQAESTRQVETREQEQIGPHGKAKHPPTPYSTIPASNPQSKDKKDSIYGKMPTTFQPTTKSSEESSDSEEEIKEDENKKQSEPTNWHTNPFHK